MLICVYDTETTGLNTSSDYILEIAWALLDVDFIEARIIESRSHLLHWMGHKLQFNPKAEKTNGLSQNFIEKWGKNPGTVLLDFYRAYDMCDYVSGHNIIHFDTPITDSNFKKTAQNFSFLHTRSIFSKPHIDGMYDLPLPEEIKVKALKYLALDHGYVQTGGHRAMSDVLAFSHILGSYPIETTLERASSDFLTVTIRPDWGDQKLKQMIYEHKFHWKPDQKVYERKLREFDFLKIPFKDQTQIVERKIIGSKVQVETNNQLKMVVQPDQPFL